VDRSPLAVSLGWLVALSVGCTEPNFSAPQDASTLAQDTAAPSLQRADAAAPASTETAPDAGVAAAPDASAPWSSALAKHYAISVRFYSKDRGLADQALYSHELIMKATISIDDAGKVQLDAQRCRDHGNVLGLGLQDEFTVIQPERLAVQSFELQMRPDGLRTVAPARAIGFDPTLKCAPGSHMRVDGRPWLADGMCTCRADTLPMLPDDCRILDEDGDGKAGISVQHQGLLNGIEPVRALDNSQIVNGTLDPDGRIRASFIENYDSLGLDCGASPCSQAVLAACPLMLNRVLFEPLAESTADGQAWDCTALLGELDAGKLFPLEMLTFVSGC
jgi:hypothetical protein